MGSYKYGYGVPLRVPLKGSIRFLVFRVQGLGVVISMVISPLLWVITVITIVTLLITRLITTHEPPSRQAARAAAAMRWLRGAFCWWGLRV